jgi:hypothetical protein
MKRTLLSTAFLAAAVLWLADTASVQAAERQDAAAARTAGEFRPTASKARKTPRKQVRGYVSRVGGYSYFASDSINTYGDSRSLYGGTGAFRDWRMDRQSQSGPFDHGFFFDSGVRPNGGDSPYMR